MMRLLRGGDGHLREIIRGARSALALKLLAAAFSLIFNLLLARKLGAEGSGIFFLALMVATVASVVARIGLDFALLRHIAASVATQEWNGARGYYRLSMRVCAASSVVIAALIWIAAPLLAEHLFAQPGLTLPLQIMAIAVLPMALAQLHGQALRAIKQIVASQFVLSLSIPLFGLIALAALANAYGLVGAAASQPLAAGATLAIGYWLWRRHAVPGAASREPRIRTALRTSSVPLLAAALMQLMLAWAATFFLGFFSTAGEVGIFNVAQRLAVLISFVLIAVNSISAPKFAALHRIGDLTNLSAAARGAAAISTVAAAPIGVIMLVAPTWLMSLFGAEFSQGAAVLIVLAAGQYLNVAMGSVGNLLMMCGLEKQMRNTIAAGAVANVALCMLLIPAFGALGAAAATAVGFVLQNGLAAYVVYKQLGFVSLPFTRTRPIEQ